MGHKDPAELYRDADVFIFLSVEEGSALVTYEAMASGLPVIVTPHCGSVARDGEDGFIVPIRDPAQAAEKLVRLANAPELRLAMGAAARKHIEQYTWERYGERLARAHQRIAKGAGPDGPDWLTRVV